MVFKINCWEQQDKEKRRGTTFSQNNESLTLTVFAVFGFRLWLIGMNNTFPLHLLCFTHTKTCKR